MLTKIDWISFTVRLEVSPESTHSEMVDVVWKTLQEVAPTLANVMEFETQFVPQNGRAPYSESWHCAITHLRVFTSPKLPHASVEISGQACEYLQSKDLLSKVLKEVCETVTRLDIACDMPTETRPSAFVAERAGERFKAHSEVVSASGETCYIGSKSSDRYCRVYRYNPPHERAHLLRCEFVLKSEQARTVALSVLENGLPGVAMALGAIFGWQHANWQPNAPHAAEIAAWRPERRQGKTLYWLASQVAPVLVRLANDGVIDPEQWLRDNVLTNIDLSAHN